MSDIFFGPWILPVEVAVIGEDFGRGDLPGSLVFFALRPPRLARSEFLELDRRRLRVVLPALGQWVFVIPDNSGRPRAVEKENVRRDAGIGSEHAVR